LDRFDNRTATDYLEERLGALPPSLDIGRVLGLTQGVPLALDFMCKMISERVRNGQPFDDVYEEINSDSTVSNVIARMAGGTSTTRPMALVSRVGDLFTFDLGE
jgi:hypothetical protein